LGLTVSRLIRVRFGPIVMPARLKRGMLLDLEEHEVMELLKWCGLTRLLPVGQGGAGRDVRAESAQPRRARGRPASSRRASTGQRHP
ncbi:MAG: hypothetical protein ACK4TK_03060, partial [Thiobacillaceae bacterium]